LLPASTVGHAVTVNLSWTPQRIVWIALWLSLLGGIACVVILAMSLVRGRRSALVVRADDVHSVVVVPSEPVVLRPAFLEPGFAPNSSRAVVATVALGLVAGVVVRPWVGVLIAAVTYLSIRDRRVRLAARYAPVALAAGIAVYMAGAQAIKHYATGTHWPAIFSWARVPTWIALFLLLIDAVVEWMWRGDAPPDPERPDDDSL
jgi:hypothetical protein